MSKMHDADPIELDPTDIDDDGAVHVRYGALVNLCVGLLLTGSTLALAWLSASMWGWFVVPLGAPRIGMPHAFGLSAVVYLMTLTIRLDGWADVLKSRSREATREEKAAYLMETVWKAIIWPFAVFGAAYIAKLLM